MANREDSDDLRAIWDSLPPPPGLEPDATTASLAADSLSDGEIPLSGEDQNPVEPHARSTHPGPGRGPTHSPAPVPSTAPTVASAPPRATPARQPTAAAALTLLVAMLVVLAVLVFLPRRSPEVATTEPPQPAALPEAPSLRVVAAAPPPARVAPPTAEPSQAPADLGAAFSAAMDATPSSVAVTIRATPKVTAILREGRRLGTGVAVVNVEPGTPITVTLIAEGHAPRTLSLDGSTRNVSVELTRATGAARAAPAPAAFDPASDVGGL